MWFFLGSNQRERDREAKEGKGRGREGLCSGNANRHQTFSGLPDIPWPLQSPVQMVVSQIWGPHYTSKKGTPKKVSPILGNLQILAGSQAPNLQVKEGLLEWIIFRTKAEGPRQDRQTLKLATARGMDFFIGWPTESSSIPFSTLRHWALGTRFLHLAFSARQSGICVAVNATMQSADD